MSPSMRCTALVALVLLPAAVATARPTAMAPRALDRVPTLVVEPTRVQAGDSVKLTGAGFPRNARITLLAGPPHAEATRIGGATSGQRGRFVATIRIRPHSSAGPLVAVACHDGCRVKATTRFRIVAP